MGIKIIANMLVIGALFTTTAYAGLLSTDSAEPVEAKHVELELNGSYMADNTNSGGVTTKTRSTDSDITLTVGIANKTDIAICLPYTFGSREKINGNLTSRQDGFNDMSVDLKFQFLELDGLKMAIKAGIILPTGKRSERLSDEKIGFATALIATREFYNGKFAMHFNADYGHHNFKNDAVRDATRPDFFAFSVACEAETGEQLKLAAETGIATNSDKTDNRLHAFMTVGAKYELSKLLEGYAGIKAGLTSPEVDAAILFGIILKF